MKHAPSLIATVPKLVAELKAFRDAAQSWHDFHKHTPDLIQCDELCARIKPATDAIEEAEGGNESDELRTL